MAEDRESSDRKHEKSKKRDRPAAKNILRIWTEEEKLQLAEAIDMFGTSDPRRLASRIPTKSTYQVVQMLRQLRINNRREIESVDMRELRFVVLNDMDDLFLAGGTKPLEVMDKWMDYLESFYGNERQFDKFKLFSKAFLIISECMPASKSCVDNIDFRKVYYFLYRVFNNYYLSRNYRDTHMDKYLHDLLLRVLEDIEYTSDNEKIAMHNLVSNWTSVNRNNSLKVYGKPTVHKFDNDAEDVKPILEKTEFKVVSHPLIPSFNPLYFKSNSSYSDK